MPNSVIDVECTATVELLLVGPPVLGTSACIRRVESVITTARRKRPDRTGAAIRTSLATSQTVGTVASSTSPSTTTIGGSSGASSRPSRGLVMTIRIAAGFGAGSTRAGPAAAGGASARPEPPAPNSAERCVLSSPPQYQEGGTARLTSRRSSLLGDPRLSRGSVGSAGARPTRRVGWTGLARAPGRQTSVPRVGMSSCLPDVRLHPPGPPRSVRPAARLASSGGGPGRPVLATASHRGSAESPPLPEARLRPDLVVMAAAPWRRCLAAESARCHRWGRPVDRTAPA